MIRPAAAATLTQRRLPPDDRHGHFAPGAAREVKHARRLAKVGEPVENPRALGVEHGVVEVRVGFGSRGIAPLVGIDRQTRELGRAALALGEVPQRLVVLVAFGRAHDERQRRQPVDGHVTGTSAHCDSPNAARNLRMARNRCTRTVAGLIPVASLISAAVRSSRCDSVNTSRCRSGNAATASSTCCHRSRTSNLCSLDGSGPAACSTGRSS